MMKRTLIFLIVCTILSASLAKAGDTVTKFKCANTSIIIYSKNSSESPVFAVRIINSNGSFYYPFSDENEFLQVRCEKSKVGKDFLLINNFCGGSGCAESNYALIDLDTGKEVLKPAPYPGGNASKAESILGKKIKLFSCEKYFKGSSAFPNDKGEYCFSSPL